MKQEWQAYSKSRTWLKTKIKREVEKLPFLTSTEKARLVSTAMSTDISTAGGTGPNARLIVNKIEPLIKQFNKTDRAVQKRTKKENVKRALQNNRTLAVPIVFYVCSEHGNAAKDHKEYQGKVYVDRFWRDAYIKSNQPEYLIKAIERYIARYDIKTVQWVMGPPVYMVTRPYCKHYFTPLNTFDVLTQFINPPKHQKKMLKHNDTQKYIENKLVEIQNKKGR